MRPQSATAASVSRDSVVEQRYHASGSGAGTRCQSTVGVAVGQRVGRRRRSGAQRQACRSPTGAGCRATPGAGKIRKRGAVLAGFPTELLALPRVREVIAVTVWLAMQLGARIADAERSRIQLPTFNRASHPARRGDHTRVEIQALAGVKKNAESGDKPSSSSTNRG